MTSFYGGGAASGGGGPTPTKGVLIFKGTLGISDDGATVLALPDEHEAGWSYLVVTAGIYAGKQCESGDYIICINSGNVASDLDWTVVQGNTFNNLPAPSISDVNKIIGVNAEGQYALIENSADSKLDKNNGTATGTTTFDKAQANRLELLVDGESIGGFRSIDLTPAVTDNGDDSSMRFVPLFIGEPTKNAHAATKKYVDDIAGNYLPLAGGTITGSINAGKNTVTNLKEPEEGTDATTKNYVDGEVAKAAPVSIMPIPEVEGQNLITISDSVEWPLQGLTLYGKSTQMTTTGAQLFDITKATATDAAYGVNISIEGEEIRLMGTFNRTGTVQFRLVQVPELFPDGSKVSYFDARGTGISKIQKLTLPTSIDDPYIIIILTDIVSDAHVDYRFKIMVSQDTPTFWEPYTGGKPSPSPEYPQEITNAGASGGIETTITGKNLLTGRLYYGLYGNGAASIKNENDVSLPYTPNRETEGICYIVSGKKGKTYTFSVTNPNANARLFLALYKTFEDASNYNNAISQVEGASPISITPSEDGILVCLIAGIWTDGTTTIHECTASELLQLEIGSTATAYEAPHSQSITTTTPNGLPGIPVDSGGNYVDTSGQRRWVDVIDYSNEKKYQYINEVVVDGTNVKFTSYSNGQYWSLPYNSAPNGVQINNTRINKYFPSSVFLVNDTLDFIYTTPDRMAPYFETIEELNAFCVQKNTEGDPLTIMYVMDAPIETSISPDELAAYRALHTYDGATVVSTAEDVAGLKVKYVAKAIDYQQSINAAIQETNDKIDAVYNSLVKKAKTVDEVNQLFKDWWNANWEEGTSTYNYMLERWFGKVLDDDKVYGVKLPLFETSTSPQGEYIEDSVGLIIANSTEDYSAQNDFAKTPQFWCVEVAAEKNADGSHTIYACEYIDDINVVRNGGPDNGKHLVWVLQKNTYIRGYEESGYSYIKIQCHPADNFVQWPQGTDRTGHTYSYIANPKYAAGIDDEGNIGCRTGLKPTCYMSMNQTIEAWRARGSQYSGSSACFYKWAYIMYALLTAKKGEDVGCNNYNYQYAAAVSESGVSRIILTADQANNLYVGSTVIIGNTEGNNDRGQAAMYSLVNQKRISSIEEVIIEKDASSYKAVYIDVPEGTTFNTTAGTTYISTMPYYSGWTDTVKGTIGTRYGTNLNRQPFLLQKVELMNGGYNYASDELDQWSQQDDTHYLYDFYLCEDQTKVSTNGTITGDYIKKENATLTIDTTVYTTNNSWYYIEDNLTDNNFKMLTPKKFSTSAGSGTGTRDAFYLSYVASTVRAPMFWANLWNGGAAGLSCRPSDGSPSWTGWYYAGGGPGLSG